MVGRPTPARRGDALDGEAAVSLFQQDLERRGEDRLVAAGVAGSTRTPALRPRRPLRQVRWLSRRLLGRAG